MNNMLERLLVSELDPSTTLTGQKSSYIQANRAVWHLIVDANADQKRQFGRLRGWFTRANLPGARNEAVYAQDGARESSNARQMGMGLLEIFH